MRGGGDRPRPLSPAGFGPLAPRVVALVATTLLHVLAVAALVVAYGARGTGKTAQPLRLTLMTLSALPPSRPVPPLRKPADAPRRSPERQIVAIPAARAVVVPASAPPASPQGGALAPLPAPHAVNSVEAQPEPPPPFIAEPADTLAAYRTLLSRHIRAGRPRGSALRGTVLIAFRIDRGGTLVASDIAGSSGDPNLDWIGLRMVRQASPMPAPPAGLAAAQLAFVVPVVFH